MAITISTHNGSSVSLAHDIREKKLIAAENRKWAERHPGEVRIDPNGEYEIWKSEDLRTIYDRLFGDAVRRWNEKQLAGGKRERVIKNYLSEIRAKERTGKNAKHPLYEIIYTVGSQDNPVPDSVAKQILKEISDTFPQRNPNLYPVCVALHNDETGAMHVHFAYIPVARNCKRGLETQNSLTMALKQQGICSKSKGETAQMAWQRQENEALEAICEKYGYEVIHPQRSTKAEHLTVEEYRMSKKIQARQEELEKISSLPLGKTIISKGRLEQLEQIEKEYKQAKPLMEQARRDSAAANQAFAAYGKAQAQFAAEKQKFSDKVNQSANQKAALRAGRELEFIAHMGASELYQAWCIQRDLQEQREQAAEVSR